MFSLVGEASNRYKNYRAPRWGYIPLDGRITTRHVFDDGLMLTGADKKDVLIEAKILLMFAVIETNSKLSDTCTSSIHVCKEQERPSQCNMFSLSVDIGVSWWT